MQTDADTLAQNSTPERRPFYATPLFQYGLVALVFLAARFAVLVSFQDSEYANFLLVDAKTYDQWGAGEIGFPGAYWLSPAYAWFISGVYWIFGHSLLAVRIIQIAVSLGSLFLLMRLAERHFSRAAAFVGGIVIALYGPLALSDMLHEKTALTVFLLLVSATFLDMYSAERKKLHLVIGAAALGICAIMRGNIFILAGIAFIWLVFFEWKRKNRLWTLRPLLFAAALLLPVLPITARNLATTGEFILVTYSDGFNFFEGNSEYATGEHAAIPGIERTAESEETTARLFAEKAEGRKLSPTEISNYYYQESFRFILSHPDSFLAGVFKKSAMFFNNVEIPDNYNFQFMRFRLGGFSALPFGFWFVLPTAIGGFILLIISKRGGIMPLFIAGYSASVMLFYVTDRYRLVVIPIMIICAGGFAVWLAKSLMACESRMRAIAALAGVIALGILISIPVFDYGYDTGYSREHFVLAKYYEEKGGYARTAFEYEETLQFLPEAAKEMKFAIYKKLAGIYANKLGQLDYAMKALIDAAKTAPNDTERAKIAEALERLEENIKSDNFRR